MRVDSFMRVDIECIWIPFRPGLDCILATVQTVHCGDHRAIRPRFNALSEERPFVPDK